MVSIKQSRGDRSLGALVDLERGVVSREVYVNEAIYQQELEQIFARAWLFIGHESQVSNPGDFVVSRMGEEQVILVRDPRDQRLHVFLNIRVQNVELAAQQVVSAGGSRVRKFDDEGFVVMADPDGNEFCLVLSRG